jgi:uncharacterized membrane protein YbhN (UPF0104 family)
MIPTPWKVALTLAFTAATIFLAARSGALETLETTFTRIGWLELVALFTLFGIMRILQAWSLVLAMKTVGASLRFRVSLDLAGLKGFYNLGLGGAGFVAQAIHARSRNLFSLGQLTFATISQSLLLVSALGALLLGFSSALLQDPAMFWPIVFISLLAVLSPFWALRALHSTGLVSRLVPKKFRSKIEEISNNVPAPAFDGLLSLWLAQVLLVSVRLGRMLLIAFFLDPLISIGSLAATTLFADLATVVPLTPGGIGVREFLIGLGASLGGHSELFIAAAIIDRGITIAGNVIHGAGAIAMNWSRSPV